MPSVCQFLKQGKVFRREGIRHWNHGCLVLLLPLIHLGKSLATCAQVLKSKLCDHRPKLDVILESALFPTGNEMQIVVTVSLMANNDNLDFNDYKPQ